MITTILGFLAKFKQYAMIALIGIIVGLGVTVSWQNDKVHSLSMQINSMEATHAMEKALYASEIATAHSYVDKQNQAIEEYRLDVQSYRDGLEASTEQINRNTVKATEDITKELAKDSGPSNQLRLIHDILKEFNDGTD